MGRSAKLLDERSGCLQIGKAPSKIDLGFYSNVPPVPHLNVSRFMGQFRDIRGTPPRLVAREERIARLLIWVQTYRVEYRGIRYTIRARLEREQWSVAIHPAGVEMKGRVVIGSREQAELEARTLINDWLKRHGGKRSGAIQCPLDD